jgi:hypothetical protein
MNELINQITQRTGISQNQAQQTVQVVVDFLKQKLPGPAAAQLENFVSSQGKGGAMGQQSLGGMFGGDQPPTTRP